MDVAKPSTDGKSKPTANDPGTSPAKPADPAAASAAKRPEQMFVVQKSGPVPAGAAPASAPANAPKNAFQSAITQGAGMKPGAVPPAAGLPAAPTQGTQSQGAPMPQQSASIQAIRPHGGVPPAVGAAVNWFRPELDKPKRWANGREAA